MPEIDNTLSNWTLHGQNLGVMLKNYKRQYKDMAPDHHRELGHFFNTTSAVLDTIGSMTVNSILCSIRYDKPKDLRGGGNYDNAPQPKLPPTDANLLRYVAVFPDYQVDHGNVFEPQPDFGRLNIFSSDYPPYPGAQNFVRIQIYPLKTKNIPVTIIPRLKTVQHFLRTTKTKQKKDLIVTVNKVMFGEACPPLCPTLPHFRTRCRCLFRDDLFFRDNTFLLLKGCFCK